MGKGSKQRKPKHRSQASDLAERATGDTPAAPDRAERPTSQRRKLGVWALPQGAMKSTQPMVDTASDMIGILHHARRITSQHEQAARQFQSLRAAYTQEFPDVEGFKSCLAGSVPGYDDGDGNESIIAEYRKMEKTLGEYRSEVIWVCEDDQPPRSIAALQCGLAAISGAKNKH